MIYTHPKRIRIIHSNTIEPDRKTNYVSFGIEDMDWLIEACIRAGRDTLVIKEIPTVVPERKGYNGAIQWRNIPSR